MTKKRGPELQQAGIIMIRKQQEMRATARIGNGSLLQTDAMVPDKLDLCQAIDDVVGAVCTRKNFHKSDEVYMSPYMLLCYYICKLACSSGPVDDA